MIKILTCVLMFILLSVGTSAQIYLQLEKAGTLKTTRYEMGDEITFQLKNDDKGWHTRRISGIDVRNNKVIFPDVVVHLDSIYAIQLSGKSKIMQIVGTAMQAGGVNMMLFAAFGEVFYKEYEFDWKTLASGALNVVAGTIIKKIFQKRVFKISPRKRLRLIDLNFSAPSGT
jgi:hypothetical protein